MRNKRPPELFNMTAFFCLDQKNDDHNKEPQHVKWLITTKIITKISSVCLLEISILMDSRDSESVKSGSRSDFMTAAVDFEV